MMKLIAAVTLVVTEGALLRGEPHVLAKTKVAAHVNATVTALTFAKVEYPCGDDAKVAGFTKYRKRLVDGTCTIVAAFLSVRDILTASFPTSSAGGGGGGTCDC